MMAANQPCNWYVRDVIANKNKINGNAIKSAVGPTEKHEPKMNPKLKELKHRKRILAKALK